MIDHVGLRVTDFAKMVAFYRAALAPIGYRVMMEFPDVAGLGSGMPDFWISQAEQASGPIHLAFKGDRSAVAAFHAAALAAGATDNGPPGPRPNYHPHYFGAFVLDPEGNNVEVCCHVSPDAPKPRVAKAAAKKAVPKKSPAKKVLKKAAPAKKATKVKKAAPPKPGKKRR